jgi:hypothetical protein
MPNTPQDPTLLETLTQRFQLLPDPLQRQALDFIEFLLTQWQDLETSEDAALAQAIQEGRQGNFVEESLIFQILDGES